MRLVMLGPFGFHPNKTMRSRALGFARELVIQGHAVQIVMPPWQTAHLNGEQHRPGDRWQEDGVDLVYVDLSGGIVPTVGRMVRTARSFEPDVIWGFKPKAYSGLAMWWLWRTADRFGQHKDSKRPFLITDTDDWEGWGGWNDIADYSTAQKYFFAWQERWGMTHCDLLTVASRELEKRALSMGVSADALLYLPNGPGIATQPLDPEKIAAERERLGSANRPTLLLYSRLFEFDTGRLIAILKKVKEQVADLAILTVGAGLFAEQAAEFRQQFETAGLLDSMIDVGWLEEAALPLTLSAADVGLYLMDDTLLNRTKCPVKLADMVALGIPVVAEGVGEVKNYVVDGENGLLFESGDVTGLADGLVQLLRDEPLAQKLGTGGLMRHKQAFSWAATSVGLIQQLRQEAR